MTRRADGETFILDPNFQGETFEAQAHPEYPEPQAHPIDPAEVAATAPAADAPAGDSGPEASAPVQPAPPAQTVAIKPLGWHVHNGWMWPPGHKIEVSPEIAEAMVSSGRADLA
jgi:hypothetical protein